MKPKTRMIIGWILAGLAALVLLGSASMKLMGGEGVEKMAPAIGLTVSVVRLIGIVEISSTLLFLIPRTGLLGTLLLAAYLGGAMVTHIEHGQPFFAPMIVQCIVWTAALLRFPELGWRISGKPIA